MPFLGEIRKGIEIGMPYSRRYHKYIYHACIDCGKERWTTYDHSEVQSPRCKVCENRFKSKSNPALYKKGVGSGLSAVQRGMYRPEVIEKRRLAKLGKPSPCKGDKRPWLGEKLSKISKGQRRSPRSEFKKGQFAKEKHPFWKGGITAENHLLRCSIESKQWREQVFARDNYTCQECGASKEYLHAHHIKEFAQYPELRFAIANGLTLCKKCHLILHGLLPKRLVTVASI